MCSFAQSFEQLIVARALLGFGFGGEWAAGAVLMAETVRSPYRGRAVGCVQSGWAAGWGLAILAQAVLFSMFDGESAWRAMFALGTLPALLVFYLRRHVKEPALSVRAREEQIAKGNQPKVWEILSAPRRKATLLAALLATGAQGGYYALATWLPTFLATERQLTVINSAAYLAPLVLGSFVGYLAGAWLADRIGRRMLFIVFSVGALPDTCLPAVRHYQSHEVLSCLSAGFLCQWLLLGIGPVSKRDVSDPVAGHRTGLRIQFWPRNRCGVSRFGGLHVCPDAAVVRYCVFRRRCLWPVPGRSSGVARNARPRPGYIKLRASHSRRPFI